MSMLHRAMAIGMGLGAILVPIGLMLTAEPTPAEFGPEAAANAFRWMAEEMDAG